MGGWARVGKGKKEGGELEKARMPRRDERYGVIELCFSSVHGGLRLT